MKNQVKQFVANLFPNCYTSYSGKTKTMYITNNSGVDFDIEEAVIRTFGLGLPFKIATN